MCFNARVSLLTFSIGIVFSILLINNGNIKYSLENKSFGTFSMVISFIQLMDFLFWIDLNNELGINKITTILGSILNVAQPTILYLIKHYYKPKISLQNNFNNIVGIINIFYFIYFINSYVNFLTKGKLITSTKDGYLKWPWVKYTKLIFYLLTLTINIFYMSDLKYAFVFTTVGFIFLFISSKYFKYNIGELWCFFGTLLPLIQLIASYNI